MIGLGITFTSKTHLTGQRHRVLTHWELHPASEAPGHYYLTGMVTHEDGIPLEIIRLTTTSLIVSRRGNTLITKSGSEYTLLPLDDSYKVIPDESS